MHAIPQLKFRINGVLQPMVPQQHRLTIRLPKRSSKQTLEVEYATDTDAEVDDEVASESGDEGISEHVDEMGSADSDEDEVSSDAKATGDVRIGLEAEEVDAEDAPDWCFDDGEKRAADPDYVFCPAPHRKALLHLFTKHFCQHPLFPERDGKTYSAAQIRRNAVYEMYQFCYVRRLSEVWAYMWTSWYSQNRWNLWARSTTPYISRTRTTMNAENHFKQVKHDHLPYLLRPRLDQLVYILLTRVVPAYVKRAQELEDTHRMVDQRSCHRIKANSSLRGNPFGRR